MSSNRLRFGVFVVLLVVLSLVAVGCGGGGSSSSEATAESETTASEETGSETEGSGEEAAGGPSGESLEIALKYTDGKEGEAEAGAEPLKIGLIVEKGATPSFPEMEAAADAGAAYINKNLGGVDGHPIEFVKCFIQVEEDGQKCGAQLLQAKVPLGLFTLGVVGNASLYNTIKGKIPLIDSVTPLPEDTTTKDVYNFAGGAPTILYAKAADAAEVAGKGGKVAILEVENEGGKYAAETYTVPALDLLGVEHSDPVYFSEEATTPEMVSALQAAEGTSASIILLDPSSPQQCNSLYEAMKQLGISETPVSATSICGASSFVEEAAGGSPEGWRLWGFVLSSYLSEDPEVKTFIEIMEDDEQTEAASIGFSNTVMRDMFLIARFANELGSSKWTPEAFNKQIYGFKGEAFLAPGLMACSEPIIPEQPGLCGREAIGAAFNKGAWEEIPPIAFNPEVLKK
ncbi:MAG TPA: hypothetical protein VMF55_01725 [Solirubrobacterales bacterium]|nr:hypothetical protein [Solirubrobacterales bacterium]